MKKQKRTLGAIVKIDLENGFHIYGRILSEACFAFYDLKTNEEIKDLQTIISNPILFILSVYDSSVTKGRWLKIGTLPIEEDLLNLPDFFMQDQMKPDHFSIYNANTGEIRPALRSECIGLERAAVWEPEHIESRIRDYYDNKPNIWVEQMKMK